MAYWHDMATYAFDPLHHFWEKKETQQAVAGLLAVFFLGALAVILLNRQGWLPVTLAPHIPTNPFYAINLAFTLVLLVEVVSLVFVLPCSVSKSVGKQFEILSLILLRNAFKKLVYLNEGGALATTNLELDLLMPIVADGVGAVLVFALLGVYNRVQSRKPALKGGVERYRFVATKKAVALGLLAVFAVIAVRDADLLLHGEHDIFFFKTLYVVLVFTDILLVLIAQRYVPTYHAVFRNSGYALATVLIRLALGAPAYYDAALGVFSVVFAVAVAFAHNHFRDWQVHDPPNPVGRRVPEGAERRASPPSAWNLDE